MNYLAPNPSSFRPATSIIYTPSTPSEQHPMRLSTQINPPSSRLTNSILYTPSDSSRPLRITTPQGSRGPVDSLSDLSRYLPFNLKKTDHFCFLSVNFY